MNTVTGGPRDAYPARIIVLIWAAVSALLVTVNASAIAAYKFPDADDLLRLLQVRDFLAGQSWFDVTQYRMNPPEGALMHWSRLVDIPLAAMIYILTPIFGQQSAELIALVAVPLITLLVCMMVAGRLAHRLFDRDTAIFTCLLIPIAVPVIHQLRPMRIDHHGWQLVMAITAFSAAFDENQKRSGWITGLMLALWLNISMEGLPIAAAFMALYALRWMIDPGQRARLVHAMVALTAGSIFFYLVTTKSWMPIVNYCDTVSPVHIAIFTLGTVLLTLLAYLNPRGRAALVGGFALTGTGALIVMLSMAPQCGTDAFSALDPLVREFWYDRVMEGKPIWHQTPVIMAQILAVPMVALFALWKMHSRGGDNILPSDTILTAAFLVVSAFALSLLVERSSAIAALIAMPFAAYFIRQLLQRARGIATFPKRLAAMAGIFLLLVPGHVVKAISSVAADQSREVELRTAMKCELSKNLDALNALPASDIMAPLDTGPAILFASHHKIVASGHHRNDLAMRDIIRTFTGSEHEAHAIITRRGIEYVAYCPGLYEQLVYRKTAPDGFMVMLEDGKVPAWLKPVEMDGLGGVRIWKVTR
ncbi:hypothetical protein [Sphingorhabdus sp. Alg239-R122]|uniref:hypothetical protein n=1 Tax=Sphingorhabdus sp. Alg239-R122 TaxID=2305989 RepID=UPI0013D91380|nr:hypothetical protein [Sphingorhabdus sp. Alg239-R122]